MSLDLMVAGSTTPSWTSAFFGPLAGAFFGVVLGFAINEWYRRKLALERKLFFMNLIKNEIIESITLLEKKRVNLIPIDGWNSLVNSGDIALFPHDRAIQLSDAYFFIQNYNYEAKRVRDAVEMSNESRFKDLKSSLDKVTTEELLKRLKVLGEWLKNP